MAHYAVDCWDAEIEGSYGWIECVGIAHRGCYDLESHEKATGKTLRARREFDEPRTITIDGWTINGATAGPAFKALAGAVKTAVEALPKSTTSFPLEVELQTVRLWLARTRKGQSTNHQRNRRMVHSARH